MINTITLTFKGNFAELEEIRVKVARNTEAHEFGHNTGIFVDDPRKKLATMEIICETEEDFMEVTKLVNER